MKGLPRQPMILRAGAVPRFPDPELYDAEGLVAIGGDLSVARLQLAYRRGIFPWYSEGYVPMWWSPDPRALMDPQHLHVSRSLQRRMRRGGFELTWNRCFRRVMEECGNCRAGGTWVIPEMLDAYVRLHEAGHAHSLEVWCGNRLVGGIYGVQIGAAFAAESMFHRQTDMSKVALVAFVHTLFGAGIELMDVQFVTSHLASLGAYSMPRREYLQRVRDLADRSLDLTALHPVLLPPQAPGATDAITAPVD
jgi:leucyl/phenylalanyl-tRNA--protein transferase